MRKPYYKALEESDKNDDSTCFIEFSLAIILDALTNYINETTYQKPTSSDRIQLALEHFGNKKFSRKDYMLFHKNISSATASRDLLYGVTNKLLLAIGDKATTKYQIIKG